MPVSSPRPPSSHQRGSFISGRGFSLIDLQRCCIRENEGANVGPQEDPALVFGGISVRSRHRARGRGPGTTLSEPGRSRASSFRGRPPWHRLRVTRSSVRAGAGYRQEPVCQCWPATLLTRPVSSSRPKNGAIWSVTCYTIDWKQWIGVFEVLRHRIVKLCSTSTLRRLLPDIGLMHVQVTSHRAVPTRWSFSFLRSPRHFPSPIPTALAPHQTDAPDCTL